MYGKTKGYGEITESHEVSIINTMTTIITTINVPKNSPI